MEWVVRGSVGAGEVVRGGVRTGTRLTFSKLQGHRVRHGPAVLVQKLKVESRDSLVAQDIFQVMCMAMEHGMGS